MEIKRAYDYARNIGFPQINIDLIAGMIDETEENWKDCVKQAIALEPECNHLSDGNPLQYNHLQRNAGVRQTHCSCCRLARRGGQMKPLICLLRPVILVTSAYTVAKIRLNSYTEMLYGVGRTYAMGTGLSFGHVLVFCSK